MGSQSFASFPLVPEFIRAKTWLSCELLGLLFIWYHAEDEPPSWHLVDCPEISSGQWKVERRFEHTVHCHIQDIAENGADVGHFNKLHQASCLMTSDQFAKTGGLCWWGQLATHSWDAKWTSNGHMASVKVDTSVSLLGFSPDFLKQHVDVRQVGPALVILHMKGRQGDTLIVQALIPEGPLRIRVLHSFFPEPGQPWLMRWIYVAGFRSMVRRLSFQWQALRRFYTGRHRKRENNIDDICFVLFYFERILSDPTPRLIALVSTLSVHSQPF